MNSPLQWWVCNEILLNEYFANYFSYLLTISSPFVPLSEVVLPCTVPCCHRHHSSFSLHPAAPFRYPSLSPGLPCPCPHLHIPLSTQPTSSQPPTLPAQSPTTLCFAIVCRPPSGVPLFLWAEDTNSDDSWSQARNVPGSGSSLFVQGSSSLTVTCNSKETVMKNYHRSLASMLETQ
jgi:hypothetical protein